MVPFLGRPICLRTSVTRTCVMQSYCTGREVLRNRAVQIHVYLLTYLRTYLLTYLLCVCVLRDCEQTITSKRRSSKTGLITSPNYPAGYSKNLRCLYYLIGQDNERVQLFFVDFEVKGVLPRLHTPQHYKAFVITPPPVSGHYEI